jgi:hypothetical protein
MRAPARAHTDILNPSSGDKIGEITSGGFCPSANKPFAMGYVISAASFKEFIRHLMFVAAMFQLLSLLKGRLLIFLFEAKRLLRK